MHAKAEKVPTNIICA